MSERTPSFYKEVNGSKKELTYHPRTDLPEVDIIPNLDGEIIIRIPGERVA
jgi:hypothetical protein